MIKRFDKLVPLSKIVLEENTRVRRQYPNLEMSELISSISHHMNKVGIPAGLKHPLAVDENYVIIAGARRYKALKMIAKEDIDVPCTVFQGLTNNEKKLFEMGENVIRQDFEPIDLALGLKTLADEMDFKLTEDAVINFAELIKLPKTKIRQALQIGNFLEKATPAQIKEAKSLSGSGASTKQMVWACRKVKKTDEERVKRAVKLASTTKFETKQSVEVHNLDCKTYLSENLIDSPKVRPFNLIMTDFPYGINLGIHTMKDAKFTKSYDDSPDVYFELTSFLAQNLHKILDEDGVLLHWLSMRHYCWTIQQFKKLENVRVRETPLGWFKMRGSNTGDQALDPMPSWEPCLFICRGKPQVYGENFPDMHAEQSNKLDHISEKPLGALQKWFKRWGVPGGSFLDPTCGSGISLMAARERGMQRVVGCEIDPEFHKRAKESLERIEELQKQQTQLGLINK